jgi:importin subunit alpha-2
LASATPPPPGPPSFAQLSFALALALALTQVLDAGVLKAVPKLLVHAKKGVRKEACWLLSNVAAGSSAQIETLVKNESLLKQVAEMAVTSDWEVRKECAWTVSNILTMGKTDQAVAMTGMGGLRAVVR